MRARQAAQALGTREFAMARRTRRADPPAHKPSEPAEDADPGAVAAEAKGDEAPGPKPVERPAAEETKIAGAPQFRIGDKLRLIVKEPESRRDARPSKGRNYRPVEHVGEVERVETGAAVPRIDVRWHLPAALGHDTEKGTVSTLVHIADAVWLEARKVPRNVAVVVARIGEEEYRKLLAKAASPTPPASP